MELDFEKPLLDIETRIADLAKLDGQSNVGFSTEIAALQAQVKDLSKKIYEKLTAWETVQVARHPNRPMLRDYIAGVFSEFIELHGDRCFGDDAGIIGGFATVEKRRVMLIGHQKGKTVEETIRSNFGMASPEGYRKALRLMHLAERCHLPIVSFIDTPGAYPGAEAEARGQAEAIARNLTEMATLEVPIVVVVTGEGGSGGAIGIGVGDAVLMLTNAVYSVISPEGCASILWRDGSKAPEAAAALKLTASSLLELGVVDDIIPEPDGGAHRNHAETLAAVKQALLVHLDKLARVSPRKLVERRFEKYTAIGRFEKKKVRP
jgi:acetyl-CoA carboxylase carboxyl transferase subunit alpha